MNNPLKITAIIALLTISTPLLMGCESEEQKHEKKAWELVENSYDVCTTTAENNLYKEQQKILKEYQAKELFHFLPPENRTNAYRDLIKQTCGINFIPISLHDYPKNCTDTYTIILNDTDACYTALIHKEKHNQKYAHIIGTSRNEEVQQKINESFARVEESAQKLIETLGN